MGEPVGVAAQGFSLRLWTLFVPPPDWVLHSGTFIPWQPPSQPLSSRTPSIAAPSPAHSFSGCRSLCVNLFPSLTLLVSVSCPSVRLLESLSVPLASQGVSVSPSLPLCCPKETPFGVTPSTCHLPARLAATPAPSLEVSSQAPITHPRGPRTPSSTAPTTRPAGPCPFWGTACSLPNSPQKLLATPRGEGAGPGCPRPSPQLRAPLLWHCPPGTVGALCPGSSWWPPSLLPGRFSPSQTSAALSPPLAPPAPAHRPRAPGATWASRG